MISQDRLDIRPAATVDDSFERLYQQGPYNPDGTYNPDLRGFGYAPPPSYPGMMPVGTTPMAPQAPAWGGQPNPGSTDLSQPWMQTWGGGLGGLGGMPAYGAPGTAGPAGQPGVQPNDPYGGGGNYQNTSYGTQNNPWGYFNGLNFDDLWAAVDTYGQVDPWSQEAPARPEPPKESTTPKAQAQLPGGPVQVLQAPFQGGGPNMTGRLPTTLSQMLRGGDYKVDFSPEAFKKHGSAISTTNPNAPRVLQQAANWMDPYRGAGGGR